MNNKDELLHLDWYLNSWSAPTKDTNLNESLTKKKRFVRKTTLTEGKWREVPFDNLADQFYSEFNRLALDQTAKDFIGHASIVPFDWVIDDYEEERIIINLEKCDPNKLTQKMDEIKEVVNRYVERGEYDCSVTFRTNKAGVVIEASIDIEGFYDLPADKDCLLGERKQYRRYHAERIKAEKEAALKAEQESDLSTEEPVVATEALEPEVEEDKVVEPVVGDIEEVNAINENQLIAILSTLINSEFTAIQEYKQTIEALEVNSDSDSIVSLLHDIAEEEMVHVGELQKALELVSPKLAEKTEEGKVEAEEKLEVEAEPEVVEDEVIEDEVIN